MIDKLTHRVESASRAALRALMLMGTLVATNKAYAQDAQQNEKAPAEKSKEARIAELEAVVSKEYPTQGQMQEAFDGIYSAILMNGVQIEDALTKEFPLSEERMLASIELGRLRNKGMVDPMALRHMLLQFHLEGMMRMFSQIMRDRGLM